MIAATRNNTDKTKTNKTEITRKQKWEEKQLYGHFKQLTSYISHEKTWIWLRKGNLKRETEFLPIAAQNNVIRTNHIKAKIDKTQQNSKCGLCGDRDETNITKYVNICKQNICKFVSICKYTNRYILCRGKPNICKYVNKCKYVIKIYIDICDQNIHKSVNMQTIYLCRCKQNTGEYVTIYKQNIYENKNKMYINI